MASRLIKIRLPFLFLFCLEMFKENCLRMSESHREGGSITGLRLRGPAEAPDRPTRPEKSKNQKFFSRLAANLKRRLPFFSGIRADKKRDQEG